MVLVSVPLLLAHDVITTKLTWSAEISRIVYHRCASCHRPGGTTPMALIHYDEVRPWAKAIRDEVLSRRMPPWGAIKGYGDFRDDLSMTQEEITLITAWVEGGAPEGNPLYLPKEPSFKAGVHTVPDGKRLKGPVRLSRAGVALAIAPLKDTPSAKVYARLPDGSLIPMLWLFNYEAKWRRNFVYRTPVNLPAGTVVEANPATNFELIVRFKSSAHPR